MNSLKNEKDLKNTKAYPGRGRNPFVGKDGKLNKVSVGLSAASLALVLTLGAFSLSGQNGLNAYRDSETATQIIDEQIPLAIESQYVDTINKYSEGDMTADELAQYLSGIIADYIESSGLFTDLQVAELNNIIAQYIADAGIQTQLEDNRQSINAISNLLGERYQANYDYITNVEATLRQMIEANGSGDAENSATDDTRYEELTKMDTNLKLWIDNASNNAHSELNETKVDLTETIEELRQFATDNDDKSHTLLKAMSGAVDFEEGHSYKAGEYVFADGALYVANTNGASSLADFTQTDLETIINNLILDMNSKFDAMQAYIDQNINDINTQLAETTEALQENIEVNKADIEDQLNAYKEATTQYLNDMESAIQSDDSNLRSDMEKNDSALNTALNAAKEALLQELSLMKSATAKNFEDSANALSQTKTELKADLVEANNYTKNVEDALKALSDIVDENDADITAALKDEADAREAALNTLTTSLDSSVAALNQQIAKDKAELINKINTAATTSASNLATAKSELVSAINSNTELDAQTKDYLLSVIDSNAVETADDLKNLSNTLTTLIDTTNSSLTKLINDNAKLSEDKRAELLAIVNQNDSNQKADVLEKYNALTKALGDESQSLTNSINVLKQATEQDIANLDTDLNEKIDAAVEASEQAVLDLDTKYATYYNKEVSLPVGTTTTLTGDIFKTYSNVNVVYSNTDGFTAKYTLNDGSLAITLTKDASDTAPGSVKATVYVDNSSMNSKTVEQ